MSAFQVDFLLAGYRDPDTDTFLAAGQVYTYLAGTSTLSNLWTDRDKGSQAANPIILDAYGRAEVYGDNNYKFIIKDSDDALIETIDGLNYGGGGVADAAPESLTGPFSDFPQPTNATEKTYFLDPDGADRDFDPDATDTFTDGMTLNVYNIGDGYNVTFDASGIAEVIYPGQYGRFVYDSTADTWR